MLGKRVRHQLIKDLIVGERIGTQLELARSLQGHGCPVTQATISRDVRELGLQKRRDHQGQAHYVLPHPDERRDPEGACAHMLQEFGVAVLVAQNLIVLKCDVGTAPGVGRCIDELEHDLIVGCVAGDDTVLIVAPDAPAAGAVAAYLQQLGG